METVSIYLAGGMTGLTLEDQTRWRNKFRDAIKFGNYDCTKNVVFFSPTDHYSIFENEHKSEREVMEYDLYHLRKSNLVVVNFNKPDSLGTAMELIVAKENKVPVIGLNKDGAVLHPWVSECCTRVCDTFKELVEHVANFYLK